MQDPYSHGQVSARADLAPTSPVEPTAPVERKREKSLFVEVVETLLLTFIIFLVVNTATGRFRIEGPSMYPTLVEGEYTLVNKLIYVDSGPIRVGDPQRGDIIVFRFPRDNSRDLIKRVIGLPGETVEVKQGRVWINSHLLNEPYIQHFGNYSDYRKLGPNEYYVLGDNRNNSSDSHNWGVLPRADIVGRAEWIYWPLQDFGHVAHYDSYNLASLGP